MVAMPIEAARMGTAAKRHKASGAAERKALWQRSTLAGGRHAVPSCAPVQSAWALHLPFPYLLIFLRDIRTV